MPHNYTLHDLPPTDRPRERLKEVGVDNLSAQELLALVIERGGKNQNVLQISQNLLSSFGNLNSVKQASLQELQQIKGIGPATACKLQSAFKLGQKAQITHKRYGQKIESPEDVFNLLKDKIGDKKKEHFMLLSLDSRNKLISIDKISIGTANASLGHPREVFRPAIKNSIKNSAISLILAHNHPSSDPTPSQNDVSLTKKLVSSANLLEIKIKDHLIVTKNDYYSFKENSIL